MEVKVDISKFKILEDFFQDLSQMDQKKIFMASFRKAAKPLIIAAKTNAPLGKNRMIGKIPHLRGQLKRSIGSIEMPDKTSIFVGSRLRGASYNKGWYAHFLEEGTKERRWRKQSFRKGRNIIQRGSAAGKSTGRVRATHFFENAFNQTWDQVSGAIEDQWYNEIERLVIRTDKKLSK
jgi:HK97 gp10 family phage protein